MIAADLVVSELFLGHTADTAKANHIKSVYQLEWSVCVAKFRRK